ncbi:MAG TPA: LPS export ABC transporter periplasmic protein LptC [Candidatus Limnocylindria bacterium]|nr:LPS export ABC transporter periplasmic protein LptC [Candidatus Limnocylindria bacterium]
MRNLARGILAIVALFVVLVAGTLVAKSRANRVEPLDALPSTTADLQIKEVDLEEETRGVRWRLKAEQALMYEKEGQTKLRNLAVQVYQQQRLWTIVGEEGDLDQNTKNVEIRGAVVLTSSDGMRLETTVMRWDAAGKVMWTDAPVTLSRDGSVVRGSGLKVHMDDEVTTVSGRVRATFVARERR